MNSRLLFLIFILIILSQYFHTDKAAILIATVLIYLESKFNHQN